MSLMIEQGEWCDRCGTKHQARERLVLCLVCRRNGTANYHAICESCEKAGD